ncbi:MAG: hypothetical protein FWG14_10975, partial [Peptococcaceae bacterium]|nr:hypothetical protein [Peptococcaceae bacterium]
VHVGIYTGPMVGNQYGYNKVNGINTRFDDNSTGIWEFNGNTFYDPQKFFATNGSLIPGVSFVPNGSDGPVLPGVPNAGGGTGKVAGSFLQAWKGNGYKEKMWELDLGAMKLMGMNYLILQDPLKLIDNEKTPLKYCLQAAQRHGIKLIIGLSTDKYNEKGSTFFNYPAGITDTALLTTIIEGKRQIINKDLKDVDETLKDVSNLVKELSEAEGIAYNKCIYGWYFNQEFYNCSHFAPSLFSPHSPDDYAELLSFHLNGYIKAIEAASYIDKEGTQVSLDRPLILSPFFTIHKIEERNDLCNVTQYETFLKSMFDRTKFRWDIFMPQAGFGTLNIQGDDIEPWIKAFQTAAKYKGIRFWINSELFQTDPEKDDEDPTRTTLINPAEKFIQNYHLTGKYLEENGEDNGKHCVFSWNHYYNPSHPDEAITNAGYSIEQIEKDYHIKFRDFVVDT